MSHIKLGIFMRHITMLYHIGIITLLQMTNKRKQTINKCLPINEMINKVTH